MKVPGHRVVPKSCTEMEELLQAFQPDLKRRRAQATLHGAWHRVWEDCGPELLHCYDIPGLPPDIDWRWSLCLDGFAATNAASLDANPQAS